LKVVTGYARSSQRIAADSGIIPFDREVFQACCRLDRIDEVVAAPPGVRSGRGLTAANAR
jgi:hypothetical protein